MKMKVCKTHFSIGVLLMLLGVTALWALTVSPSQIVAQGGPIVLDGVARAGEWDPTWQVATDSLDVFITGSSPPAHPHDAPYYARSGYDAIGLWAHYDVAGGTWYFRLDVDGRAADSDSQIGTAGNLSVGTHAVDQGPLGGDSDGIGPPEAYRLRFHHQSGGTVVEALLGYDSTILPGVVSSTTQDLIGQGVYSTTVPGVIEWAFDREVIIPTAATYGELWLAAQMGDNSDRVSDDEITATLLIALDLVANCPAAPIVIGDQATFPMDYAIPAAAALGVSDVVLTADVPAGTTFVSASNGGTESGGVITWHLGDLSPGDAGQVTFTVHMDASVTSLTISSEMACAEGLRYPATTECPVLQPTPTPPPPPTPTGTRTPTPTGTVPPTSPPPTEIPEGSTFLLLGGGLAAMAGLMALARARLRR